MRRVVIFGNSGSGKTSMARRLSKESGLAHLDLDEVAWKGGDPPVRESIETSVAAIDEFRARNSGWIIEGCYSSLISHAARDATEMYFLNIGIEACIENCRARPWEPGKYSSAEAQDAKLAMLIDWVKRYEARDDEFSLRDHREIFAKFEGKKREILSNTEA
ncbi:MAG: AAA family ATPase [Verrucomicrobiaceae bacterium]